MLTELLPHQVPAVEKLSRLRIGALFMEMGLGKTRTAMEFAVRRRQAGRCRRVIWFCPVSVKETIVRQIEEHAGEQAHEFGDRTTSATLPDAFWHVVGIESMSASARVIEAAGALAGEHTMCVADESSYIKGFRSKRTTWITRVGHRCRYRLILTGTPITKGVEDLYAQMNFLDEKVLGYRSFYSFAANHLEYSEKYPGMVVRAHNTAWLTAKMAPYVYQVTKAEALTLPPKVYETRYLRMTPEQRERYEQAKSEILGELLDDEVSSFTIFRLFTALQQIVSGYWNRRVPRDADGKKPEIPREWLTFPHARLDLLRATLAEIPADAKVIVWAKFIPDIHVIRDALGADGVALFYGLLGPKEREGNLDLWRRPNGARVLLATPGCGGHGLTLNEATHVIFYNNEFKYGNRLQAEDRNHRIGQTRTVTYIDLVCSGSIDERIMRCHGKKGNVIDEFKREVNRMRDKKSVAAAIKSL
jgi:SNF2 family DNA or RNA helicase